MEEPEQLSSIYYNMQTAISRDLSLDILPLHHRSVRKPLGAVLKSYSITITLIWKGNSALAINSNSNTLFNDVNMVQIRVSLECSIEAQRIKLAL